MHNSDDETSHGLHWSWRLVAVGVGLALVISAFFLLFNAPTRTTSEFGPELVQPRRVVEQTDDLNPPFITLVAAGCTLLVFGLNGLPIAGGKWGSFDFKFGRAARAAKRYEKAHAAKPIESPEIDRPRDDAPEPVGQHVTTIALEDGEHEAYDLFAVPPKVLADAILGWPGGSPPSSLLTFQFAARKPGQGNNAWKLKFEGNDLVTVTYGGQGKKDPTVKAQPAG